MKTVKKRLEDQKNKEEKVKIFSIKLGRNSVEVRGSLGQKKLGLMEGGLTSKGSSKIRMYLGSTSGPGSNFSSKRGSPLRNDYYKLRRSNPKISNVRGMGNEEYYKRKKKSRSKKMEKMIKKYDQRVFGRNGNLLKRVNPVGEGYGAKFGRKLGYGKNRGKEWTKSYKSIEGRKLK